MRVLNHVDPSIVAGLPRWACFKPLHGGLSILTALEALKSHCPGLGDFPALQCSNNHISASSSWPILPNWATLVLPHLLPTPPPTPPCPGSLQEPMARHWSL